MNRTLNILAVSLLTLTVARSAVAQSSETKSDTKAADSRPVEHPSYQRPDYSQFVIKTYYLANVSQQSEANEILTAMRNVLTPYVKMYLDTAQNAIVLSAPPDQQALAQTIITDLDRPQKTWRLTYTLAESDGGKRIGVQHFSFVLASGQRTVVKQGSKIPVMTGSSKDPQQTQFQYLDIGMNFDATINTTPGGIFLRTKVEQSAVGSPSEYGNGSGPLAQEPIIHQTSLEGSSIITPGKPLTLGSVDLAGSTRHIDIEVVAEPVS